MTYILDDLYFDNFPSFDFRLGLLSITLRLQIAMDTTFYAQYFVLYIHFNDFGSSFMLLIFLLKYRVFTTRAL